MTRTMSTTRDRPSRLGSGNALQLGTFGTNLEGRPDGTPGNPKGTALSRGVDDALGTNISGARPENERRDPPGTMASRGMDDALGTNVSGADQTLDALRTIMLVGGGSLAMVGIAIISAYPLDARLHGRLRRVLAWRNAAKERSAAHRAARTG